MKREKIVKLTKILVLIFMSLTFVNILLPDSFVIGIHRLNPEGIRLSVFQMIIRWFNFSSFVILPVAVYFDKKIFKKVAIYFCLPVALIYFGLVGEILPCYTDSKGTGIVDIRYLPEFISEFMRNGIFRGFIFVLMCLSQLLVIGLLIYKDWTVIKFKKSEIIPFILLLFGSIITILPIYALEGIFNTYSNFIFKPYGVIHFSWIILVIGEGVVFTMLFKNKSYEDRYILVLVLALSLFLQFNQLFSSLGELTCKRMPFQLCNIAAYIILISILSKSRNLFLFNILVNVVGGLIALVVMDAETSNGILSKGNIHYIVEHHNVILTPILCLTLGIFTPIKKEDYKMFFIYFTGYFLIIFVLGTIFNSIYNANPEQNDYFYCNYLFMFDQETAARLVGYAGNLFNIKIQIGTIKIYPLIQSIIYVVYLLLGTGMFFLLKRLVKEKNVEF